MASAAALAAKQKEAEAFGGAEAAAEATEVLLSASTSASQAPESPAAPAPPDPERHEAPITNPHGETLVHHLTIAYRSFSRD